MRLRAPVATALLTALLLLAPTALADEGPATPTAPLEAIVDDGLETMDETVAQAEDEAETTEDELQSDDDQERDDAEDARQEDEDTTQQVLEDVAAVDESVEALLTELDLLQLELDDAEADEDNAPESKEDAPASTPLTTTDAAPRNVDLVTPTILAAAAVGTLAVASKTGILRFLSGAALGLFSRFQGPRVLDNPRRAELNNLVCKRPGITVPDLCNASRLSRNAVLHHLRMLEDQGMIVHRRMGRSTHWFENGGRYGRERKDAYAVLHDDRTRDVAQFILAHPGSHQGAIGSSLGLSPSVVHWHMKRLEDAALVQRERSGRSMLCYPGGPLSELSF